MEVRIDTVGQPLYDIGFDENGDLDTADLISKAAGNDAFVRTWYDQSGNANDAQNTSASQQPQIVNSGSLIIENGKPCVAINSTTQYLVSNNASEFVGVANSAIIAVTNFATSGANRYVFHIAISESANLGIGLGNSAGNLRYFNSSTTFNAIGVPFTAPDNVLLIGNYNSPSMVFRYNGNESTTSTVQTGGTSTKYVIGKRLGTSSIDGNIQECIAYPTSQHDNINGIETNINSYFSIY